jgi:hypothetical protein
MFSPIRAYNIMFIGYKVKMEWGICDLKREWKQLMKRFHKSKVHTLIQNCGYLDKKIT